ncbi:MAG: hypothetical protein DMF64_11450 [Acidobacteria bacterium]|nr:MAG: hypothetical protein DMF64_11450 [Acidobacteriota bacterium]
MQRTNILALALALAIGLLAGLMLNSFTAGAVHAQQSDRRAGERWEYCAITDVSSIGQEGKTIGSAKICYFQASGCRKEAVETTVEGNANFAEATKAALARATAKLGAEGWEMLGDATQFAFQTGDIVDPKALYFRRQQK